MRNYLTINESTFPEYLRAIPDPPQQLYSIGDELEYILKRPRVAIIGSRRISAYGKAVTEKLAGELAKKGIVVVSGLALGIDAIAQKAAVSAGGRVIAVLASGLDNITPSSNCGLAKEIVQSGGVILSEYPDGTPPLKHHFVARNRLVSGLSDIIVVTEAAEKSGTMHTAQFAKAQGKPIMAVPANITSFDNRGTNLLIKHGAQILLDSSDVFELLGLSTQNTPQLALPTSSDPNEQTLLNLIARGTSDATDLLAASKLPVQVFYQALTMLEINGMITNNGSNQWNLR